MTNLQISQLPAHIAQQGPDEDHARSEDALRELARRFRYDGKSVFPNGVDLSPIAGDGVILSEVVISPGFDNRNGKFHLWVHQQEPDEPGGYFHKRFTVALFTKEEHPTYGAPDKSFKLKGLLYYGAFWEWLLE